MPRGERTPDLQLAHERLIEELQDLIAALDRCASPGDTETIREFARSAAALRRTALTRLLDLRDKRAVRP